MAPVDKLSEAESKRRRIRESDSFAHARGLFIRVCWLWTMKRHELSKMQYTSQTAAFSQASLERKNKPIAASPPKHIELPVLRN